MQHASLTLFVALCEGRDVHDKMGVFYMSPGGEPYVNLSGPGGFAEAVAAFNDYAEGRRGTVYWRCLPEIHSETFFMRLFIGA